MLSQQSPAFAATSVDLGTATPFSVLAAETVTNTGPSTLQGNLGVSPGTAITGFPPGMVTPPATIHSADAVASQAQIDARTAYNNAAGQPMTGAVTADLADQTLVGGVYTSTSTMALNGQLTLNGQNNPASVFIFQVGSSLNTGSGSSIILTNGAQACNVFWQIGSSATLGTTTNFKGTILAQTSIAVLTGARIEGRALALTGEVTLQSNVFTTPSCATTPTETAVPTSTITATETGTPTETGTATSTATDTAVPTSTITATETASDTGTAAATETASDTGTATATETASDTGTAAATETASETATVTATRTATAAATDASTTTAVTNTVTGDRNRGTNVDTAAYAFDARSGGGLTASGAFVVGLVGVGGILLGACLMVSTRRDSQD